MIAVPIVAKELGEALEQIHEANRKADFIELRLDFLKDKGNKAIEALIGACRKKVIATARPKKEGGFFNGSEEKRIALLLSAVKLGADFVDIEFSTKKKLLERLVKNRESARIILSHHDFKKTPEFEELTELFDEMAGIGGGKDIFAIKIVCTAKKQSDNNTCLDLVRHAKRKGKRIVCFCMGKIGRDSRILSVPFGAYFTFASLRRGLESAKGQIAIDDLKKIYHGMSVMF